MHAGWRGGFILLIASLLLAGALGAAESEAFKKEKARLLIEKGKKAFAANKVEEAVAAYEEAYEAFPANVLPLLLWGDLLCQVGLYSRADQVIRKIPIAGLPANGQAQVHLMRAKIALASETMDAAVSALNDCLKAQPRQENARVQLAMIHFLKELTTRAEELVNQVEDPSILGFRERSELLLLDLAMGNFGRAWSNAGEMAELQAKRAWAEEEPPVLWDWVTNGPMMFLGALPLGLHGLMGWMFLILMLGGVVAIARQFTPPVSGSWDFLFLALATIHVVSLRRLGVPEMLGATLHEGFSLRDTVWLLPRQLIGIQVVTLSLFLIMPMFRILPQTLWPRRTEMYSIWFFCWWFMLFILVYQSRLGMGPRMTWMGISLACSALFVFTMPLGRYLLFLVGKTFNIGRVVAMADTNISGGGMGFTDAKIQESKVVRHFEEENFTECLSLGKKILQSFDRKSFPQVWLALLRSHIELEDLFEAERTLKDFQKLFGSGPLGAQALLMGAWLKSYTGDHTGAFGNINSIPGDRAKGFPAEDAGLSLLILGRCNIGLKEAVQAHIDLMKAMEIARLPLTQARILCELAELDTNMSRLEWGEKWLAKSRSLKGGAKTKSYQAIIESILAQCRGDAKEAWKHATDACRLFERNGRAAAWRGHLLCLQGKAAEAEVLLEQMTAGTFDAQRLMAEITDRSGKG